jgi:copper chaperone CopZ
MTQQTFAVDGLRCEGCADTVKAALLALDGVSGVDVTLGTEAPSSVRVEARRPLDPESVQAALAAKGDFLIRP